MKIYKPEQVTNLNILLNATLVEKHLFNVIIIILIIFVQIYFIFEKYYSITYNANDIHIFYIAQSSLIIYLADFRKFLKVI